MIYTAWVGSEVRGKVIDITVKNNRGNCFAPTWGLVIDFKEGRITWEQYETKYMDLIRLRMQTRMKEFTEIAEMAMKEDICLVCFCKNERFCHRRLAKEILLGLMEKREAGQ